MFYGYCRKDDFWTLLVHLETAAQVFCYCCLHHIIFDEVRITDEDDYCVMHVIGDDLVFPTEAEGCSPEGLAEMQRILRERNNDK